MTKLCECGCGVPTRIATMTNKAKRRIAGQPSRFISGHNPAGRGPKPIPLKDRFWAHVDIGAAEDCWPWTLSRHPFGYGQIGTERRMRHAHRVAYELTYGVIPAGAMIRHRCDNPPCCNPAHLVPGTHADNTRDMVERGRSARGSRAGNSILVEADIPRIFELRKEGLTYREIGEQFGVTQSTIANVLTRKRWTHVEVSA